jgi:uncharacterized protein HemX
MKLKLIILIAAIAVAASGVTFVAIHIQQQAKDEQAIRTVRTATTNMMRELKPLTAPSIFPEK